MRLRILGVLAAVSMALLGCEVPMAPLPPPPPPADPPPPVTMRAELVRPHAVASRRFDGDGYHYIRPEMYVSDAIQTPLCHPEVIEDRLRYETRKVTRPEGVRLEMWVVGGFVEFTTGNSVYCWQEGKMEVGRYALFGNATYTSEPRPGAPTTTTVPCGSAPFVPGGNAADVPPLCSDPFDPIYWPVRLLGESSAFRFVK